MQLKSISNCYISCGCNRSPHCLTWGSNNLVYYGSCNAIAVYDPTALRVLHTAVGHKEEVRSVRFVAGDDQLLISTSSDKSVIIWKIDPNAGLVAKSTLLGHTSAVAVAHAIRQDKNLIVATTSTDLTVKVWLTNTETFETSCIQTIKAGSGFCLDVRLHTLPNSGTVVLACAQDDFKISLHTFENEQFVKKESLVGHEDWVTCLDWIASDGELLLSSGSQDTYIRLWKISLSNALPKRLHELDPNEDIQVEGKIFSVGSTNYSIKLESVLLCHNSWIQSVSWTVNDSKNLSLLSSSTDGTICVWDKTENVDLWSPTRLGILKEDSLGILGCVWSSDSRNILAHSLHGALHKWDKGESAWKCSFTVGGGHFANVVDLCWEPNGDYLFSCSADQTSRIHALWKRATDEAVWFELGRPQVHGYDMTCIAAISSSCFISGADEKVLRVFKSSKQFLAHLKSLCGVALKVKGALSNVATQQELGLSNLSVDDAPDSSQALILQVTENLQTPFGEEILWKATLWPEERKLYGHGFEMHCLAASHSGRYLASACRARMKDHAFIIIWNVENWTEVQKLFCHELTVTQLEFSPDDSYLLAVSRDRCLSVYKRSANDVEPYQLTFSTDKKSSVHTRVIWSCSWSTDGKFFVTGSREGRVVVWSVDGEIKSLDSQLMLKQAVTALAFVKLANHYLIAVGCEDGEIRIYQWQPFTVDWTEIFTINQGAGHHKTVRRLAFNPRLDNHHLLLASCSDDHSVKIFKVEQ